MTILKIKEKERLPLILLFTMFFCIVSTSITGSSVRDTFFLINFDKSYLPIMYILIAFSMAWIISIYKKLTADRNQISIITVSNLVFIIPIILIKFNLNGVFIPILYIWIEIITVLSILQFWMLAGDVFNPRQAKRIFTLIGAGGSFSAISIGYIIKPYINYFGPENLLYLTIIFISLTIYIAQKINPFLINHPIKIIDNDKPKSQSLLEMKPYIKYIALMVVSSAIISKIVDYQFKIMASNTYTNQDELISYFGSFYVFTGLATLVMQFFVTNFVLRYFGILLGLMILPIMLTLSSAGFLITGTMSAIYLAKFSDQVFKFSINNSIQEILWLPIKLNIKKITKPIIDGTLKSSIEGLAGFFIFILSFYSFIPESKVYLLSIFILLGAIFWIYNNFRIKNGYINSLVESIDNRDLFIDDLNFDINDSQIVQTIDKTLKEKDELKQLFVLDILWKHDLHPWLHTIKDLLQSENYKIRRAVLELTWYNKKILPDHTLLKVIHSDEELRPFAIVCAGDRKVENLPKILEPYLISNSSILLAASSSSIIRYDPKHKRALTIIKSLLNDQDHKKLIIIIGFLKKLGHLVSDEKFVNYFQKKSNELKIECLEVIKESPRASLLRLVIDSLSFPGIFLNSERTLLKYRKELVLEEFKILLKSNHTNEKLKLGILKTMHNYDRKSALSLSMEFLDITFLSLTNEACNSLIKLSKNNDIRESTLQVIDEKIYEIANQAFILHLLKDKIKNDNDASMIIDYIEHELKILIKIILKLGTIKDPEIPIEKYISYVHIKDPRFLPLVIELIDTTFNKKNKKVVLPLVDPDLDILYSLEQIFPNKITHIEDLLLRWIRDNDKWKMIIFIHYLLLKENSILLAKIKWDSFDKKMFSDNLFRSSQQNYINRNFLSNQLPEKDNSYMYSILEKTIILKSIDLFSQIPSHILTQIGKISNEVNYEKDFTIFKKGDYGESLFIIVKGKINIIQDNNLIAVLEEGSCIGEMALLDHEPRSANAETITEATLLQIDQGTFYDLMATSPDIIKQIIKILSKRLRDVNQKLISAQK